MKLKKKVAFAAVLLLFGLIIHLYSNSKARVESGYSIHFFYSISRFLRTIFGKLPFSFGDILYGLLVCWLCWKLIRFFMLVFRKNPAVAKKPLFMNALLDVFIFSCCIYIVFNVFWGINYNRQGIAWQLDLNIEKYKPGDLEEINAVLVEKVNASKKILVDNKVTYPSNKGLFIMVSDVYKNVSASYPFLAYQSPSIKSSMWGWLGNYTGFTGYYNPFTAEAQLNTTIPKFLQPFVACHEVAHQLGYAKEMEANFVGYFAATNSGNSLFKYSVYLDLFIYANRNLYFTDSVKARKYGKELSADVVADLNEWKEFNRRHQSIAEPLIRWVYGKYLQGNEQPNGVLSYDEVTAFIIAYYKKFGRI